MTNRTDQVIEAVRRLDALEARRKRLTEELDQEIAAARAALDTLLGAAIRARRKPQGRQSKVGTAAVELLRQNPNAGNAELAVKLYGSDTPSNRHKVRAQFFNLKRAGRIKRKTDGSWEVTEPTANGHDRGEPMHV